MGRWGPGNFESDTALDYLHTRLKEVVKDIVLGLSPHAYYRFPPTYIEIVGAVDLLVRIGQHYDLAGIVELTVEPPAEGVRKWSERYLQVYDAVLTDKSKFDEILLRQTHQLDKLKRQHIVDTFAQLEMLVERLWSDFETDPPPLPDYTSPIDTALVENYIAAFARVFAADISMRLAPDYLQRFGYHLDYIRVDADILAFLGTSYQMTIGRSPARVRYWRESVLTNLDLLTTEFNITNEDDRSEWLEEQRITAETFDKLLAIAEKYPASWRDSYGEERA